MKIQIIFRNLSSPLAIRELSCEMDEENYRELKRQVADGNIKMIEINNTLFNISDIGMIRPLEETISKKFRLPGKGETTLTTQEKEFQIIKNIAEMGKISEFLKKKGILKQSPSKNGQK